MNKFLDLCDGVSLLINSLLLLARVQFNIDTQRQQTYFGKHCLAVIANEWLFIITF